MQIDYKGYNISINEDFLDSQKAWKNIKDIIKARIEIIDIMAILPDNNHKELLEKLTNAEYDLQKAWNFKADSNYHSYQWIGLEDCTCPTLDNIDNLGTDIRYVDGNCPWHSTEKDIPEVLKIKSDDHEIDINNVMFFDYPSETNIEGDK
jgi:hypothetical protein